MAYQVEYLKSSLKQLRKLNPTVSVLIKEKIESLAESEDPLKHNNITKLVAKKDTYRYRISDYRVFFKINANELIITIIGITHRKDSY